VLVDVPGDFGAGVAFNASAQSPWLNFGVASIRPKADFGLTAGIMAAVTIKPSFTVDKAGLWAEVWGSVACDYHVVGSSGTWVIASVRLSGNLTVYFPPAYSPTKIEGDLKGQIEVIGIKADCQNGKVKQVIFNLLSNAVKFTDHGTISLTGQFAGFYGHLAASAYIKFNRSRCEIHTCVRIIKVHIQKNYSQLCSWE
jgi:hypothetical protein